MDLITLLVLIGILCLLLWIVNMSGWIPLPVPARLIFNIIILVVFVIIALDISGVHMFHNIRVGAG